MIYHVRSPSSCGRRSGALHTQHIDDQPWRGIRMQSSFPFEQTESPASDARPEPAATLDEAHEVIELDHGRLDLYHQFLIPEAAERLFQQLQADLQWQQASICLHGKEIP